jgi:hypothetical protein
MVAVIDNEPDARTFGITLTVRAEQRWGHTAAWRQRRQRVATYPEQDWLTIRTAQAGVHQRLLDAMRAGTPHRSRR